jgi:hypothetical protein
LELYFILNMTTKNMDRNSFDSYDRKLISILEIVGSHFVDIFFNHVWASAHTNLKSGTSITDEYTRRVKAYILGVKTDERCYRDIVTRLHEYFRATTRYTTLSFSDFVERIISQFIPLEYYDLLNAAEKDETLGSVIADLISGLGTYVTRPDMLRRIIDEHDLQPKVTIRMIQDQGVTVLLAKRSVIHNNFLRKIGQATDTVSSEIVDDLKKALVKVVKQKAEIAVALKNTSRTVKVLEDELSASREHVVKLEALARKLSSSAQCPISKDSSARTEDVVSRNARGTARGTRVDIAENTAERDKNVHSRSSRSSRAADNVWREKASGWSEEYEHSADAANNYSNQADTSSRSSSSGASARGSSPGASARGSSPGASARGSSPGVSPSSKNVDLRGDNVDNSESEESTGESETTQCSQVLAPKEPSHTDTVSLASPSRAMPRRRARSGNIKESDGWVQ